MKLKTLIYGASTYGKSMKSILESNNEIEVVGFIDDNKEKGTKFCGLDILGGFSELAKLKEQGIGSICFSIGYTNMKLRGELFRKIKKLGFEILNVIHPNAIIDKNVKLGSGIFIRIGAIIGEDVEIEDNVVIGAGSLISHNTKIHENVFIAGGTILSGFVEVHEGTFIGVGATIIDKITIGKNVIVGAGAVVIKNVPDNVVIVGVPAKVIRYNQ